MKKIYLFCIASLLLIGCSARQVTTERRTIPADLCLDVSVAETGVGGSDEAFPEEMDSIGLLEALALALKYNPELRASGESVRAARARAKQACLLPNPELELAVEEFDRDGEGFESAETAVVLGQRIELGGKRQCRKRVAEVEGELAVNDLDCMRLDVSAETMKRFTSVLAAQARLHLARSAVELADKTRNAVGERVNAGKEPPLQKTKSSAELEMVRMSALDAESSLDTARKKLAAMWGAKSARFKRVEGSLDGVPDQLPSLDSLRARIAVSPAFARTETEVRLSDAALAAAKAARVPDVEVSIGYLQYEEDGTDAMALAIGVPLPFFDRNQGNVAAAASDLAKANSGRLAAEVGMFVDLEEIYAELESAYRRVKTLRDKVLPAMEQSYASAYEGYEQGKFDFLDMLDAQRGLLEAREAMVEALAVCHAALADLQRITGATLSEMTEGE